MGREQESSNKTGRGLYIKETGLGVVLGNHCMGL